MKAASRPNAHAHILAVAATCLALDDRVDDARALVGRVRVELPDYCVEDFIAAFRFLPDVVTLVRAGARRIGF